jgi:hypothetical protein
MSRTDRIAVVALFLAVGAMGVALYFSPAVQRSLMAEPIVTPACPCGCVDCVCRRPLPWQPQPKPAPRLPRRGDLGDLKPSDN